MSWNYSELSKLAKALGGPEEMLYTIERVSRASGRAQMIPWIGAAAAAGGLVCLGVISLSGQRERERRKVVAMCEQKIMEELRRNDRDAVVKEAFSSMDLDDPSAKDCLGCPNRDAVYPSCEEACAFKEAPTITED